MTETDRRDIVKGHRTKDVHKPFGESVLLEKFSHPDSGQFSPMIISNKSTKLTLAMIDPSHFPFPVRRHSVPNGNALGPVTLDDLKMSKSVVGVVNTSTFKDAISGLAPSLVRHRSKNGPLCGKSERRALHFS